MYTYIYIYRYIYILYIYIYVCVCTEAILFVLGWGEGRFCTSHITEADGTADLEVEHNKSWSCFLRMATILLQISVPCANFWMEELAIVIIGNGCSQTCICIQNIQIAYE